MKYITLFYKTIAIVILNKSAFTVSPDIYKRYIHR